MVNVKLFDDLDEVERDAAGALDRSEQRRLFDRLDWFRLVATHTLPGPLLVLRAEADGDRGWLFFCRQGGTVRALANWYSLGWDIIAAPGRQPAVEQALVTALKQARPRIAALDLFPVAESSNLPALLAVAGWIVRRQEVSVAWRIATRGMDFDTYWATRPGKLRSTARRKAKAANLDIEILDRFDPAAWADYEAVYRASWKGDEGSPAFLRALAEQEGAAGTLRLGIARKDGEPIAAQLWLTENGTATIHKLAYREDRRDLSPGTILSMAMFRHALDADRVDTIDFGLGDDGYKADWMGESEAVHRLAAFYPRSPAGLVALARAAASKLVRRMRSG